MCLTLWGFFYTVMGFLLHHLWGFYYTIMGFFLHLYGVFITLLPVLVHPCSEKLLKNTNINTVAIAATLTAGGATAVTLAARVASPPIAGS